MPNFWKKNIIFDLDGTLIDSFPGIFESLRHAVSVVDPKLDLKRLKNQVGPPLPTMLSRMWPDLPEDVRLMVLSEFRSDYNNRGYLYSVAYPGVAEALNRFRSLGVSLFVLTNKPLIPTKKILSHLGMEILFKEILSPDSVTPSFSVKAEGALHLMEKHALITGETLLVGDSPDDLNAAQVAGFSFVEVSYGYGNFDEIVTEGTRLRLKSPSDLAKLIN
jgi:phosphoglycolate phosphatase